MKELEWGYNTHYRNGKPILFIEKLLKSDFNEDQIKIILDAMNTTCEHCWDTENGCTCSRDE